MTVKELIELLSKENPDATAYTMDRTEGIALNITEVKRNALATKEETVIIH